MEPAEYLDHLRRDGPALAVAARQAPGAAVPSCPDWDMTALVGHAGIVHRWVDEIVRTSATEKVGRRAIVEQVPADPIGVVAWYDEGLVSLIATLAGTDPAGPVWNWFDNRPAPAAFWLRRMAHETAIHRWDAQAAVGPAAAVPMPADLAVDGIDEFLMFAAMWVSMQPVAGFDGSLHLHATDTRDGEWYLTLAPDHLEQRREHAKADAAVRGTASDLLLWLLNRKPAESGAGLEMFGDHGIIDAWRTITF